MVALIMSTIGIFTPAGRVATSKLGSAITNYTGIGVPILQVGSGCGDANTSCTGTQLNQFNFGTCYIKPYATTIVASSTAVVDCQATALVGQNGISPLTGIVAGQVVQAELATSTAGTTFLGLTVDAVSASTTSGYIQITIANLTGTTFTWPTSGTASGTATYIATR